jgi:hypothetical protein
MKGALDILFRYCAQRFAALQDIFAGAIALTPLGFGFEFDLSGTQSNGDRPHKNHRAEMRSSSMPLYFLET